MEKPAYTKEQTYALIRLLDDPNESIFDLVKEKILLVGEQAMPFLKKLSLEDENENKKAINRAKALYKELNYKKIKNELYIWNTFEPKDILYGAWLVAKYQYPSAEFTEIDKVIENLKQQAQTEMQSTMSPLQKIRVINHILFEINGFSAHHLNLQSARNSFIDITTKTKTGNHLTIATIYLSLARRLKLPLFPVGLPQNLILAYVSNPNMLHKKNNIIFYINPINKGTVFGKTDIISFLSKNNNKIIPKYYQVSPDKFILSQLIKQLVESYKLSNNEPLIIAYNELLTVLKSQKNKD